jgi:hypothetical protein
MASGVLGVTGPGHLELRVEPGADDGVERVIVDLQRVRRLAPLLVLFVLPSLMTGTMTGWLGVLACIAVGLSVKCGIFAYYEPTLSKGRALWVIGLANVVTTFVGFFVMFALSMPPLLFLLPLLYGLTYYPMQRLAPRMPSPWLGPNFLSILALLLFLASYSLFYLARAQLAPGGSLLLYWLLKLAYIYPALVASLGLTTLWEEWLVSRWAPSVEGQPSFYGSVLRANLVMLLLILGLAAVATLPRRLATPGFLLS